LLMEVLEVPNDTYFASLDPDHPLEAVDVWGSVRV